MLTTKSREKLKKILSLAMSLTMLFSFCACESNKASDIIFGVNDQEKAVEYIEDKTVYLAIEKLRGINPIASKDADVYDISKLVYDSLFELDGQLVPQKLLVDSYYYDEDGTSLTLVLRNGVKFHNGEYLNGNDVKFTIDAIMNLAKYGETIYASHVASIKSVSVDKNNANMVVIKYSSNSGNGLENLIFPILPASQFKNAQAVRKNAKFDQMIGTGPYKQSDYLELTKLVLTANPEYFGQKANNTLVFQVLPDSKYAVNMAESGDISLFFDAAVNKDTILSKYNINVESYVTSEVEVLGFNFANQKLAIKAMRQALAYAIDAENILETAYYKNGVLTDSLYYPDFYGVENKGDMYPQDYDKSKRLLGTIGYADRDDDGILESKEGEKLSLRLLVNDSDIYRNKAASIIMENLQQLGVLVELSVLPMDTYMQKLAMHDFDLYVGGFRIDERYDLKSLLSAYSGCFVGYENEEVTSLLTEFEKGRSELTKPEIVSRIKEILKTDIPYYMLTNKKEGCYYSNYFGAVPTPMFNNVFRGCENWVTMYPKEVEKEQTQTEADDNTVEQE